MILIAIFVQNENIKTIVNICILGIILFFCLGYRGTLFYYNTSAKVAKMIINQGPPIEFSNNIYTNPSFFTESNYEKVKTDSFEIYYLYEKINTPFLKKIRSLDIHILIKSPDTSFYSDDLTTQIHKIEESVSKRERASKVNITIYKKYEILLKKDLEEISEVICLNLSLKYYTQINVGLFENKLYFLYSKNYFPSIYYKNGVEKIIKMFKTKNSSIYRK
jgi:hypothetical protein